MTARWPTAQDALTHQLALAALAPLRQGLTPAQVIASLEQTITKLRLHQMLADTLVAQGRGTA